MNYNEWECVGKITTQKDNKERKVYWYNVGNFVKVEGITNIIGVTTHKDGAIKLAKKWAEEN